MGSDKSKRSIETCWEFGLDPVAVRRLEVHGPGLARATIYVRNDEGGFVIENDEAKTEVILIAKENAL